MSQVKVSGNASGTGVFTIASPNSNTNYTLTLPESTGTFLTTTSPKAGNVLQVLQTVKTDGFNLAGGTWTDVTGFSVSITPASASNKILVMFSAYGSQQGSTGTYAVQLRLVRDATTIYVGNAAGSAQQASAQIGSSNSNYAHNVSGTYLDSPATTSAVTYKLQMYVESGGSGFLGGSYATAAAYTARVPSQILVMEIAG